MKLIKIFLSVLCLSGVIRAEQQALNNPEGLQRYYSAITKASKNSSWWDVINYSEFFLKQYPKSEIVSEVTYLLAKAYFNVEQFELSNKYFSDYLKAEISPKHYEDAIVYKFNIAKNYYQGIKKHLFGIKKMPKIIPSKEDALLLFNEVLNAMPHSEMAIESLFYKGKINADLEDYKESIDSFQTLIRKYPKHELAIESYLEIEKVFLKQADPKRQDPNLLDMAEINLKRFKEAFPKEERIIEAEKDFRKIQEIYAEGLFEIGKFYERTKKVLASEIYYKKIISLYPDTLCAKLSKDRLGKLEKNR